MLNYLITMVSRTLQDPIHRPLRLTREIVLSSRYILCKNIKTYYTYEFAPYSLVVNHTPANLTNDVEPNNYIANALSFPINTTITGHIGYYYNHYDDTTDVYSITLPLIRKLTIDLNPEYSQNVYATLYDNNGTTVLFGTYSPGFLSQTKNDLVDLLLKNLHLLPC